MLKDLDLGGRSDFGTTTSNIDGAAGARHVADMLLVTTSITVVDLRYNSLDTESATMLATIAKEKHISLCGITPQQTEADFSLKKTGFRMEATDAMHLTADLTVRASLTSVHAI